MQGQQRKLENSCTCCLSQWKMLWANGSLNVQAPMPFDRPSSLPRLKRRSSSDIIEKIICELSYSFF